MASMETTSLSREQLYEQVWAEPVTKIAARLGISDVALAKACRKLRVPLPRRGYWAKIAAGQPARRPMLPRLRPGESNEYRVTAAAQGPAAAGTATKLDRELQPENAIVVDDTLTNPHPLVAEAQEILGKAKANKQGILQRLDRRCLDLRVSPAQLNRGLRIWDALLKALEKRGYPIETIPPAKSKRRNAYDKPLDPEHPPKTMVTIGEHVIEVGLSEGLEFKTPPAKRPPSDAPFQEYWKWRQTPLPPKIPTGKLTLTMKGVQNVGRQSWSDGKRARLETSLNSFVRALIRASNALEQHRIEAEEQARKWKAWQEERDREEREEHLRAEREKVLNDWLLRWRTAREIRAFVAEARDLIAQGKDEATSETDDHLEWALVRADEIDPLTKLRAKAAARG